MQNLPEFRLEKHFAKWEFNARYHMTASDMQSMSLKELLNLASDEDRAAFENTWLGYTEAPGSPVLREEIAKTYDTLSADDVLCFVGAEEGLYTAMHVLLGPGDHAIVVTPNYQSAESVPLLRCDVSGIALDENNGWSLDIDALAKMIKPNTKLISVNFPHNPTGRILEKDRFEALIELCRKHGIWLFSDEVYRGIGAGKVEHLPQAADRYERALSLNVMSKAYGLPGLRLGWIACQDRDVLERLARFKDYLSICSPSPSEQLSIIALRARKTLLERSNRLIAENLQSLEDFFAEFPDLFDWRTPDGGCVAFPRYLGAEGAESFVQNLVEKAGVLLLPASIYRSDLTPTPQDRFRIGFGREGIAEGLAAMRAYIHRNSSTA